MMRTGMLNLATLDALIDRMHDMYRDLIREIEKIEREQEHGRTS